MSRTIPSVAAVQSERIDYSHFVKVAVGGVVGDKYFTERTAAAGTETLTYNIDGSSRAYTIADVIVGPLDQSEQDTLGVSWLSFANLDYTWTNWANTPGLRNADVEVWRGQFDVDSGALLGSWKMYVGKIDGHECGDRALLALKPHATPWTRLAPSVTGRNLGAANLIPDKSKTIHWGGERPV